MSTCRLAKPVYKVAVTAPYQSLDHGSLSAVTLEKKCCLAKSFVSSQLGVCMNGSVKRRQWCKDVTCHSVDLGNNVVQTWYRDIP